MFDTIFQNIQCSSGTIKICGFSTGSLRVKKSFNDGLFTNSLSPWLSYLDPRFTDDLPIWVWLIDHPEGVFLFDTGEICAVNEMDYFGCLNPWDKYITRSQFDFKIKPEDEIDFKLSEMGYTCNQINNIVISHLHFDHTDGLKYFQHANVLISKLEWEKPFGAIPELLPAWLNPEVKNCENSYNNVDGIEYLTKDNSVMMVMLPGHTYGHVGLLIHAEKFNILLAADVSYTQSQLLRGKFAAANVDFGAAQESYNKVLRLASQRPLIYLPSHDPHSGERLRNISFLIDHD